MTNSVAATLRHWRHPEVLALREEARRASADFDASAKGSAGEAARRILGARLNAIAAKVAELELAALVDRATDLAMALQDHRLGEEEAGALGEELLALDARIEAMRADQDRPS